MPALFRGFVDQAACKVKIKPARWWDVGSSWGLELIGTIHAVLSPGTLPVIAVGQAPAETIGYALSALQTSDHGGDIDIASFDISLHREVAKAGGGA
jgi:hypothetical protein